jgi:predicted TIM-barrel enzyme
MSWKNETSINMKQSTKFQNVFQGPHVVLPVIHVLSSDQAVRNAEIAYAAGADGIFLINHGVKYSALLDTYRAVVSKFPQWWIGINCLDLHPSDIFTHISSQVSGVWTDNALIYENMIPQPQAEDVLLAIQAGHWHGLYFGGVAFKYQHPVEDVALAASIAMRYMDVVTTSGPGTGLAAHIDKIYAMKAAIGKFPLAIASGITPENIIDYLPCADCFLVATGISRNFEELDPVRVKMLVKTVSDYGRC